MNILVTGGAGYIGSHCVKHLQTHGHTVVVLDNLSTGFKRLVTTPNFVEGDIADTTCVQNIIRQYGVTALMHFAASASVAESVKHPEKYYQNNVQGSLALFSTALQAGVKKVVFSSSCAVYGIPETLPITEETPKKPVNPYGFSKFVTEQMLSDFNRAYGLNFVSLRYFNAAGADPDGQLGECHEPESHLIPLALQAVQTGKALAIYGTDYDTPDGTCIRDYVDIQDIAEAHRLALDYLEAENPSRSLNIGSEAGYSVQQVLSVCEQVTGKTVPVIHSPRREGDPPVLVANAEKIKSVLGWQPKHTQLETMVSNAWRWEQARQTVLSL